MHDAPQRPVPDWLVDEPFTDVELGVLKQGKEAQVDLVERTGVDGRSCLVARKRYLPRQVKEKGALEALGVQRASTFRHDVQYREGRQFRKSRDRRAVELGTTYGKRLMQDRWTGHEHEIMTKLWEAGLQVPYPLDYGEDVFELEYVGDRGSAAPQLHAARLSDDELADAFEQLVEGLRLMVRAGWVHADLSAYNLLWWEGRLWFIDFPQAIDLAANPQGLNYLHHDVENICAWFARRRLDCDPEAVFADLLVEL